MFRQLTKKEQKEVHKVLVDFGYNDLAPEKCHKCKCDNINHCPDVYSGIVLYCKKWYLKNVRKLNVKTRNRKRKQ
jgi:hypothetical protein